MNASMPAEVIVSPLKEIQRCLVVNRMNVFKMGIDRSYQLIRREQFVWVLSAGGRLRV